MKKLGCFLLLLGLAMPMMVGCGPSKKVEVPENISEESAREKEMDVEDQSATAPAPPAEGDQQ